MTGETPERAGMRFAMLVPELMCTDFARSLRFYTEVLGFGVAYDRPEERFAFLDRNGAQLMLDELPNPPSGRSFVAAELAYPFGRGMNLQIEVEDVDALLATVKAAGAPVFLPLEEKWYRKDDVLLGNRQFIVQDPDGYLLRLFTNLGSRTA